MPTPMIILAAVVAGWMFQAWLTYQQSMRFNSDVASLRSLGTVTVGVGGNRYRGGRAYVAMAVDDQGKVRRALTLSGWTTFAAAKPLPALTGVKVKRLAGPDDVAGLTKAQRLAARQGAELLTQKKSAGVAQPATA